MQGTYRLIDAEPVRFESVLAVQWIADTAKQGGSRLRATNNRRKVVFELGAPGEIRLLSDSTTKRLFP